jgi:protoheme IX farnesyltransferase
LLGEVDGGTVAPRDLDKRMLRTRNRPLPSGRLGPSIALWFGLFLGVASIPVSAT